MKNRMKRNRILVVMTLIVTISMWLSERGTAYAASKATTFKVGTETVNASLSGDANGVMGSTSYTNGPGEVEVMVSGDAVVPGGSQVTGLLAMPPAANTPGGVSGTITPPAGKILIAARSHHYATVNGASNYCDITLF